MIKFSYSKLSTFEGCGFKYNLIYNEGHFVNESAIATDFGTLVHFVEETMARDIMDNNNDPNFLFDYNKYLSIFNDYNKDGVLGIKQLKEKYPNTFYEKDKNGLSYEDKATAYTSKGIYRLRNYMNNDPSLELIGAEQEFNLTYGEYVFHGFIDRLFRDRSTGQILIEDIKTYSAPLESKNLVTPLQFVFYSLAVKELYNTENILCFYELPLCDMKQSAGTKGFVDRGCKKIDKLLNDIKNKEYAPNPTPLCHWCVFSQTYPNQPEQAKNLCPYFCKWTRENKDFSTNFSWMGQENHEKILEAFINNNKNINAILVAPKIEVTDISGRRFLGRRI